MSACLHYFYPENDLALASGIRRYTAPRGAVDLRVAGECLAMWTGAAGDQFLSQGVNRQWFDTISEAFDLSVTPFGGDVKDLQPRPWGWSLPVVERFKELGFAPELLPTDEQLERMRQLSHRRTAIALSKALSLRLGDSVVAADGVEATDIDHVLEVIKAHGRVIAKLPWSSSGRGVFEATALSDGDMQRRLAGTISRQGSVIVEPLYADIVDFALLYEMRAGVAVFVGYSFFTHDDDFRYSGSLVAPDEVLRAAIEEGGHPLPQGFEDAVGAELSRLVGDDYTGPLGVDLMALKGDVGARFAVAEINLRCTMGHVAHSLQRFLAPGRRARYTVSPRSNFAAASDDFLSHCDVLCHRLNAGELNLVPSEGRFSFMLSIIE